MILTKQLKSVSIHCLLLFISVCLMFCNSFDSNGPSSSKLVGQWNRFVPSNALDGKTTYEATINLKKSGGGVFVKKYVFTKEQKVVSSHSKEYPITWMTKNEGKEDYLIIKYGFGKILNFISEDKEFEQKIRETPFKQNNIADTIFFEVESNGEISWHFPRASQKFKMVKN